MRRHGDHEGAARAHDPPQLDERGAVVVEVLEHVERRREVEFVGRERQPGQVAVDDLARTARERALAAGWRGLEPDGGAEHGELGEHRAAAAARVEDSRLAARRQRAPHRVEHDRPPAPIPPVPVLGGERAALELGVHGQAGTPAQGTRPSTKGTSSTFSCMTGPWPK